MADPPSTTQHADDATSQKYFLQGVRLTARQIAIGSYVLAGVSVGTALAVGGFAPFIVGGLTIAVAQKWLENIGANVLAGWLGNWGSQAAEYAFGPEKVDEHELLATLATDLQSHSAANAALQTDVELLLDRTDAFISALDELKGRQEEELILLQLIRQDQRRGDLIVGRLHHKVMTKLEQIEDRIRAVDHQLQMAASTTRSDITAPIFMVQPLPADFVPRPVEFEQLVVFLLEARREASVAITTALRGAGGYGKTTLAQAICHDSRIRQAFADGILWITLGEKLSFNDLIGRIEDLIMILSGASQRPGFTTLDAATNRLSLLLADRELLLVIDDVWDADHLKPFLQGGPRCVRLITTRNRDTLPPDVPQVEIDAMRPNEALALLSTALTPSPDQIEELQVLTARVGEWPLLLRLVNSALREQVGQGESLDTALTYVSDGLVEGGLTVFDTLTAEGRQRAVTRTLEVSLALLSEAEQIRFVELAVFPEDTNIPLSILHRYWAVTGQLSAFAVKQLCTKLFRLSLLLAYEGRTQTIRLHDVIRKYLAYKHAAELPRLHSLLLDTHRPPAITSLPSGIEVQGSVWANLPYNEPYLWDYLSYHLIKAKRGSELVDMVKDLHYLAVKTYLRKSLAVENDLLAAERCMPNDQTLHELSRRYVQCAHLLNACETLNDLVATLYSRLWHLDALKPLVEQLRFSLTHPYLAPTHTLPDLPPSALAGILEGHTQAVICCDLSSSGDTIVSASQDGLVNVWDRRKRSKVLTLVNQNGRITSCAISGDGRVVATGSDDGIVKVWNVHDGKQLLTLTHEYPVTGCAANSDGRLILSATSDLALNAWDGENGDSLFRVGRTGLINRDDVHACALSKDGRVAVSICANPDQGYKDVIYFWSISNAHVYREQFVFYSGSESAIKGSISDDGKVLVACSDHGVSLWNIDISGKEYPDEITLHAYAHQKTTGCAISGNGQIAVSSATDGSLTIWTSQNKGEFVFSSSKDRDTIFVSGVEMTDCAINDNGSIVVSGSRDGKVRVWDIGDVKFDQPHWKEALERGILTLPAHYGMGISCCAISGTGLCVLACNDGVIRAGLGKNYEEPIWLADRRGIVKDCAISRDGRSTFLILEPYGSSIKKSKPDVIEVWNVPSSPEMHYKPQGELIGRAEGVGLIRCCAISSDGSIMVLVYEDGSAKLWKVQISNGTLFLDLVDRLDQLGKILSCAVSDDGDIVALSCDDGTLKLWEVKNRNISTLGQQTYSVIDCAFDPKGSYLLSVSADNAVSVWDIYARRRAITLKVDGVTNACAFSSNGEDIMVLGAGEVYYLRLVR